MYIFCNSQISLLSKRKQIPYFIKLMLVITVGEMRLKLFKECVLYRMFIVLKNLSLESYSLFNNFNNDKIFI